MISVSIKNFILYLIKEMRNKFTVVLFMKKNICDVCGD